MNPPVMSFDYYTIGDYFGAWPGHTYSKEMQLDDSFMYLSMAANRDVAKKHDKYIRKTSDDIKSIPSRRRL